MNTKVLRGLLVIVISCVVVFGFVGQPSAVALAADTPAVPGVSVALETSEPGKTPPPKMITVTFNGRGGKYTAPRTVAAGHPIGVLPKTTKKNQSLIGWFTAPKGGTQITDATVVTGPATYYAQWTVTKKAVTLNANGGKIKGASSKKFIINYGKKYGSKLMQPAKTGYTFKGWYTAKSGGTKIGKATVVTTTKSKQTLYARWAGKKYTVKFSANGGKIGTKKIQSIKQTYGKKYILPPQPVRKGYTFRGWYTAKNGGSQITASSKVDIKRATTFYAQWEEKYNADIVVETKLKLTGSGSGWHGKLVIQDGNAAVSFGIQHDTHSGIGPQNQDYLMFESVRNSPVYHSYTGYRSVAPGWHTIRLEYSRSKNKARGYCDGEFIAEVDVQPMGHNISINKEAIPRMTGDTVDASFKDTSVCSKTFYYNGNTSFQQYGTYAIKKSAEKSNNPHDDYIYNEQGETWRLHGTASIPNDGDWDSYPTVGVRAMFMFVKK